MGFIFFIVCLIAVILVYLKYAITMMFWIVIINAILNLWSLGILFNYKKSNHTPGFWAILNQITLVIGIIFIILGFIK